MGRKKQSATTAPAVRADELELELPTSRADVHFPGDPAWEKLMEPVGISVEAGKFKLEARMNAWPMSPVPLAVAGILCLLALHAVGAPMWAMLTGMLLAAVLPFTMAVVWSSLRTQSRRG